MVSWQVLEKTFTYTNVLNAITRMDIQVYCDLFGFYTLQYEKKGLVRRKVVL